ncbi:MAG: hypothetical protein J7578_15490 [Chitinophagaceae bacterium]|nr:hypothetical protein [Chitinophagaceae bacterium]
MRWLKTIFYILFPLSVVIGVSYLFQELKDPDGVQPQSGYQLSSTWPQLPDSFQLGNPVGLGIDTNQNIVVFHRAGKEWSLTGSFSKDLIAANTILVIHNQTGNLLNSWGSNLFVMPHGLAVDKENNIWVTDIGLHQVFKFTYDGKLLLKLGIANKPGKDSTHFNKPTDIAIAPDGSFFVSDGYGNSRIIKFSPEGKYLSEWGNPGSQPGELEIPHALCIAGNRLFVADRENNRVQQFDLNGHFIKELNSLSSADITSATTDIAESKIYTIDDLSFMKIKHRGSDIIIADTNGVVLNRFGRSSNDQPVPAWFHDIVVDNEQNIFVGDILHNRILKFEKLPTR